VRGVVLVQQLRTHVLPTTDFGSGPGISSLHAAPRIFSLFVLFDSLIWLVAAFVSHSSAFGMLVAQQGVQTLGLKLMIKRRKFCKPPMPVQALEIVIIFSAQAAFAFDSLILYEKRINLKPLRQ
jgi:hypothetical protein